MMNCYYYLAINIKENHLHTLLKWQRPKVSQRKKENQLKLIGKSSSHVNSVWLSMLLLLICNSVNLIFTGCSIRTVAHKTNIGPYLSTIEYFE